jgi:hypothetical protein
LFKEMFLELDSNDHEHGWHNRTTKTTKGATDEQRQRGLKTQHVSSPRYVFFFPFPFFNLLISIYL